MRKCVNKVQLPSSPKNRVCATDRRIIGAVNQDDGNVGTHTRQKIPAARRGRPTHWHEVWFIGFNASATARECGEESFIGMNERTGCAELQDA